MPEYATELRDLDGARTAILDCLYGMPEPPPGWKLVASFTSSGEAQCWCCSPGAVQDAAGNAVADAVCSLCEGDGYVFLGDGWREVVFAPDEFSDLGGGSPSPASRPPTTR